MVRLGKLSGTRAIKKAKRKLEELLDLGYAITTDALSESRKDEDVIQGKAGEFAREDVDLGADVERSIQNEPALPTNHAETALTTLEVGVRNTDVHSFGERFEFLKQLGVGHGNARC